MFGVGGGLGGHARTGMASGQRVVHRMWCRCPSGMFSVSGGPRRDEGWGEEEKGWGGYCRGALEGEGVHVSSISGSMGTVARPVKT